MLRDPNIVGPKNKYDATIDPTINNDQTQGYAIGSQWINVTTGALFTCFDAATGVADWQEAGGGGVHVDTVDPTVNDDDTNGFDVGDLWLNTTTETFFQCINNATGAAVWRDRTVFNDYDYLVGPIGQAPFQTIQAAVDQAVIDGGWGAANQARIGIMDGVYVESVTLPPWMILESVTNFTYQHNIYKLGQRVEIVGTVTYNVTSGNINDVTLIGIFVNPSTGPAIAFTGGDFSKRLYLFDCWVDESGDASSDTVTATPNSTYSTIIFAKNSTLWAANGHVFWELTQNHGTVLDDSIILSPAYNVGQTLLRLDGGWLTVAGQGMVGRAAGAIYGHIEVKAGSTDNKLQLEGAWFFRGSGLSSNVTVDGTLNDTYSFFKNCLDAPYPSYDAGDLIVDGTNSSQFFEEPKANADDVRMYNGQQWKSVSGSAVAAVTTPDDYNMIALATTLDQDPIVNRPSPGISYTPKYDGLVEVEINGHSVEVGDGTKVADCYFSDSGGTFAKNIAAIVAGDTCHWMGSIAGYQLIAADRVSFIYGA